MTLPIEVVAIALVWVAVAARLLRKERSAGPRRHVEGFAETLTLGLLGLVLGHEAWEQSWLALSVVIVPHVLAMVAVAVDRRDGWTVAAVVLCALAPLPTGAGFRYVHTPSVPVGLYRAVKTQSTEPLSVGQTVCVDPHAGAAPSSILEYVPVGRGGVLVKKVLATAGTEVDYDGEALVIDERPVALSRIWETSSAGAALPQLAFPQRVDEGQVWLGSTHERGFDSRYFGPVAQAAINCVAEPVWLR